MPRDAESGSYGSHDKPTATVCGRLLLPLFILFCFHHVGLEAGQLWVGATTGTFGAVVATVWRHGSCYSLDLVALQPFARGALLVKGDENVEGSPVS